MNLVQPTDFEILEELADEKRNNAANIAIKLDKDRDYINTRLPQLSDYQLVTKVGPASNSGLYQITDRGLAVLNLRDKYNEIDDFESAIQDTSDVDV